MSKGTTEQQIDDLRNEMAVLQGLQEHAGYRWLISKVELAMKVKQSELYAPPSASFPEPARTYVAGELRALNFCTGMIQNGLDNMASSLRALEMRVENTE